MFDYFNHLKRNLKHASESFAFAWVIVALAYVTFWAVALGAFGYGAYLFFTKVW